MNKIMVLSDGTTWDSIDGCMIITLCEKELEKLAWRGDFSDDVKILEQRTLSSDDVDWFDVCSAFYHACGGMYGCGDLDCVQALVEEFQSYFEEDDDADCC